MLIIQDHQPSGEVFEFQLPGSKTRFEIPASDDVITVEAMEKLSRGDYSVITDVLPEDARPLFGRLHPPQLKQFVDGWTGSAKN